MSLHLRRRGSLKHWYARGTVRVGRTVVEVREFCAGTDSRHDAEAIAAAEEARVRAEVLDGAAGRPKRVSIAEALLAYLKRPGGLAPYDASRLRALSDAVGERPIAEARQAWSQLLSTIGRGWKPATAARVRALYVAGLRAGCASLALPPPPAIPSVRQRTEERVASLTDSEREALLAAYSPSIAPPVILLAYAGLRTQECLQLQWSAVDFRGGTLTLDRTKSGRVRVVPMHERVRLMLSGMWHAAGKPARGPVFLNAQGRPFPDTRGDGGNPIWRAHMVACRRAGVRGFRVHDWRHDFAARFLAEGGDTRSLMQIMGWTSPVMVQRYVTYRSEHLAAIIAKVA